MKILSVAAVLAGLAIAGGAGAATNLLTNGSFADGLTGWNLTTGDTTALGYSATVVIVTDGVGRGYPAGAFGDGVIADNAAGPISDSDQHAAYFSSDIGREKLSQDIHLLAGHYQVGFDAYVPNNGYNNPHDATFDAVVGSNVWGEVMLKGTSIGPNNWKHYSGDVTITAAQALSNTPTSFTFSAQGYPAVDVLIDRVYVAAVPEPISWSLMVMGFGSIGALLRNQRRRQFTAA